MRRVQVVRALLCGLGAMAAFAATFAADAVVVPAGVQVKVRGDGWAFTDGRGMTLYTFDRDEGSPGQSACNDDCAVAWPPLAAPASAVPNGDWAIITRDDQSRQWTFRGRPVYLYKADTFAGAAFGDGANGQWHVAFMPIATPREVGLGRTALGRVLTDTRGLTLYTSKDDCNTACQKIWEPIAAPSLANGFGDWTISTLGSGMKQWVYKGQPLYRRPATDIKPGEITGNGVRGWTVMVLEQPQPLPPWATVQASDAGDLIGNAQGFTVYAHDANPRVRRVLPTCATDDCLDAQWSPFIADANAKPVGSWTLVRLPDGRQQWAYKGQKIFLNHLDKKPGDFKGIRFGGDRSWSAIMRSGEPMQGVSVGG